MYHHHHHGPPILATSRWQDRRQSNKRVPPMCVINVKSVWSSIRHNQWSLCSTHAVAFDFRKIRLLEWDVTYYSRLFSLESPRLLLAARWIQGQFSNSISEMWCLALACDGLVRTRTGPHCNALFLVDAQIIDVKGYLPDPVNSTYLKIERFFLMLNYSSYLCDMWGFATNSTRHHHGSIEPHYEKQQQQQQQQ